MSPFLLRLLLTVTFSNHIYEALNCPKDTNCGPCGGNSQSCTLNCNGEDYCKGGHSLICKTGVPCILNCDGSNACTDSILIPNNATSVTVLCTGSSACSGNAILNCQQHVPCDITCDSGNCDSLIINVNDASDFICDGGNCPPSIPAPYAASTIFPTGSLTPYPTPEPTQKPTSSPTTFPTPAPTNNPTSSPTDYPTQNSILTSKPTINYPTDTTISPTPSPTVNITPSPSDDPTPSPTNQLTPSPINNPTISPIGQETPSLTLTFTMNPTHDPSPIPTIAPTINASTNPSITPTRSPTFVGETHEPSKSPTNNPSINPILSLSNIPTFTPSTNPTGSPTNIPTPISILTRRPTSNLKVTFSKSVDNNNEKLNNSESQSFWYSQRYLLFGLLGFLFGCLCVCLIAFILRKRWNKKRRKRYLRSHASVLRTINNEAAMAGINNMDVNTARNEINIIPAVPIQRLESVSLGSDKVEIEEGINSNAATNGTSYNHAINMVDECFVNPMDENNINIAVRPHIDDESNSSNSSEDEHYHQVNISVINTQNVTKGNDTIIEEDSFTEDSTDKLDVNVSVTPYVQNVETKQDIVSITNYGDVLTPKGIDNEYIDIDKLVEGHQHTKSALSSVNNEMFKENVNNAVVMEQVILNDIVDDMDADMDINVDDNNIYDDDIDNEAQKVRSHKKNQFSQIIGDNAMGQELIMNDIVNEMENEKDEHQVIDDDMMVTPQ